MDEFEREPPFVYLRSSALPVDVQFFVEEWAFLSQVRATVLDLASTEAAYMSAHGRVAFASAVASGFELMTESPGDGKPVDELRRRDVDKVLLARRGPFIDE